MCHISMKAVSQIDLNETARMLEKSPRQVIRDVKASKLKATGGGRGVPLVFVKADVEAFKRRRSWFADADLLARVAYGYVRPAKTWDDGYRIVFAELWKWRKDSRQDLIETITRNAFPPLSDVPPEVKTWAQRLASCLRPTALDFIIAMFAARMNPRKANQQNAVVAVLQRMWKEYSDLPDKIAKKEKELQKKQEEILPTKKDTEFISRFGLKDAENVEYLDLSRSINHELYERREEGTRKISAFMAAVHRGDDEYVNRIAEEYGVGPEAVYETLRSFKHARTYSWHGSVRPGSVAAVLGIHRNQAMRLWKEIKSKVGLKGIEQLAKKLLLHKDKKLPKSWKAKTITPNRRTAAVQLVCPHCDAVILEDVLLCPVCRQNVFEKYV